jgi:release factor H-coupled RctB family protein
MSSNPRTLTVILNSNNTKKFALLIRSIDAPKETILREARNKFRSKGLSQIFLQGGTLLDEHLPVSVTQVWVGKGEVYSGPPAKLSLIRGVARVIAEKSFIDDKAIIQLDSVSALPGVRLAVGMPDLHPGNRFPIGCAIVSDGVYPALIGSDVGCGIAVYHLSPPSRSLPTPIKVASLLNGLDDPWSGSVQDWLVNYGIDRSSPFDQGSLGTVGAGNHFAEICTVDRLVDETAAASLGIQHGALYLLVHTGSRGLGASILANWQTDGESNPYIPPDSSHLPTYLAEHDYAVQWAIANRDLVAYRIKQCLFSPPNPGQHVESTVPRPEDVGKIIDVTHNSVTKHSLRLGDQAEELWVHRKGAAPADKGFVPCPGSRGDFSWLLEPVGDGQHNAHSLAHGAGRRHSRNALHGWSSKSAKSSLTTTALGSEVVCDSPDLLVEERPEAYKDVGSVVEDMANICKGIVVFRPFVTYKVRKGDAGRN